MARPRKLKPDYCHDAASGRAYVRINGQKKYLGDYGTQASRDEYLFDRNARRLTAFFLIETDPDDHRVPKKSFEEFSYQFARIVGGSRRTWKKAAIRFFVNG